MVTPRQLLRGTRSPKTISKESESSPQWKAIVERAFIRNPTKPNSARRSVVLVKRTKDGKKMVIFVPGEKHVLKEFSEILGEGGGAQDLPGVRRKVVAGALDSPGITGRKTSRSKYGTPKPKK